MKWIVVFSLIFSACSQAPQKAKTAITEVRVSDAEITSCQEYQKNILDKSYVQHETHAEFTHDLKQTRAAFSGFDLAKSLIRPKVQVIQNVLEHCDEPSIKKFNQDSLRLQRCNPMLSEVNFFQGLASAIKKYPWPTDLKLEGKKLALDYVSYYSEGRYPLMNRLIALSVLDELSVNKIVNEDLHKEIKQVMTDSQLFVQELRGQVTKDSTLSCNSLKVIRDELKYSDEVGKKIKNLLLKI